MLAHDKDIMAMKSYGKGVDTLNFILSSNFILPAHHFVISSVASLVVVVLFLIPYHHPI